MKSVKDIQDHLVSIRRDAADISPEVLQAIPYSRPESDTRVEIRNPEFTSLCPETGLPDYGTITIRYLPGQSIVELKSLKFYFLQYRDTGIYYEHLTPLILDHLVAALDPVEMEVEAHFTSRGGIDSTVASTYRRATRSTHSRR